MVLPPPVIGYKEGRSHWLGSEIFTREICASEAIPSPVVSFLKQMNCN